MTNNTLTQQISRAAGWSIFIGVLTSVIGAVMIIYPLATAAVSTVFLGSVLIVISVAQFVFAFASQSAGNFFAKLLLAIVYALAGIALVGFTPVGIMSLTAILAVMLIAQAIVETVIAFALPATTGRGWYVLSAVASLFLGVLIAAQWPSSSVWAIGTLLGAAVLFNGIVRIVISTFVRYEVRSAEAEEVTPKAA